MKDETKLIHSGYQREPTTRAVATPIYQTVADVGGGVGALAVNAGSAAVHGIVYTEVLGPAAYIGK